MPNPVVKEGGKRLIGSVIYIDRFGNLVTNLTQKLVVEKAQGRKPEILLAKNRRIKKILGHYYEETEPGNAIAIYNAAGFLEIAIFKSGSDTHGGAKELLGMDVKDAVTIEFS